MKVFSVVRGGGGGHKSLTLPAGSFFCELRIVALYAEIYGPHSMNRPKNSSINMLQLI